MQLSHLNNNFDGELSSAKMLVVGLFTMTIYRTTCLSIVNIGLKIAQVCIQLPSIRKQLKIIQDVYNVKYERIKREPPYFLLSETWHIIY